MKKCIDIDELAKQVVLKTDDFLMRAIPEEEGVKWRFYRGDHWQGGTGWVGPIMSMDEGRLGETFREELERQFVSYNAIREVCDRKVYAVLAKDPQWDIVLDRELESDSVPTEQEQESMLRAGDLARKWAHLRNCVFRDDNGVLRRTSAVELWRRAITQQEVTGRFYVRVIIPSCYLDDNNELEEVDLEESLERVHVELCDYSNAGMYVDDNSLSVFGIYSYEDDETGDRYYEVVYVDNEGDTVVLTSSGANRLHLNGLLTHYEGLGNPLITDSIVRQQKDLNRTLTMGGRNMNLAGFRERVLFDAQMPLRKAGEDEYGKDIMVPKEFPVGAGAMNVFQGLTYQDNEGRPVHARPDYKVIDPVGNVAFDTAAEAAKRRIREEADQQHVEMSSDATASGKSREMARHEFQQSLGNTISTLDSLGRWMIEVVIRLANQTSNESADVLEGLRVSFEAQADIGPVSAADRAEDRAQVKDGLLSAESAMVRSGIDDTTAEFDRIVSEGIVTPAKLQAMAGSAGQLISAGANPLAAYELAGFTTEEAEKLVELPFDFVGDEGDGNE